MTIAETIIDHVKVLTASEQVEVLDFVEYIETKARARRASTEDTQWSQFSLATAMRGIEDEPSDYRVEDLRQRFQ